MIDFSEIQEVDITDLSTWPMWFRWAMVALIAAGLLYGGYKYFLKPEKNALAKLEHTERQLKDAFLIKKELVINLPAYKEQMLEIQDRFGVVLKQLPDKTEVPALLIDISQAGLTRGLKFRQFKPANQRTEEFYITLPISVVVAGKFHQFAEFISDLASLPRIVTLGNMNVVRDKTMELVMQAELFTYQYLEESTGQAVEEKVRAGG